MVIPFTNTYYLEERQQLIEGNKFIQWLLSFKPLDAQNKTNPNPLKNPQTKKKKKNKETHTNTTPSKTKTKTLI